jgi:S1-C subfamily serine protease
MSDDGSEVVEGASDGDIDVLRGDDYVIDDDIDEEDDDVIGGGRKGKVACGTRKSTSSSSHHHHQRRRTTNKTKPNAAISVDRKSSSSRTRPVVKLMVTSVGRSYAEPWRRKQQREGSGTGFLVGWKEDGENNDDDDDDPTSLSSSPTRRRRSSVRVITNAHVVRDASTVRMRSSFGPHVVNLIVEWLSLPLDLALLSISDGDWDDFRTGWGFVDDSDDDDDRAGCGLVLSPGLPRLDENVTCVGFPTGGTQISVTRGVVSRIDVDSHSVLRMQIDAAINPGNSGGPVFDESGHVVGVACAHLRSASNIGYIIPSKIVEVFLGMCMEGMEADIRDRYCGLGGLVVVGTGHAGGSRHVPGIPNLATIGTQNLESRSLRRQLGLVDLKLDGGIRIVGASDCKVGGGDVEDASDDYDDGRLRRDDVLLGINGHPIGMDGTIQLSPTRPDERINYRSLVTCQRVGSSVTLDVLRNKQRRELEVMLDQSRFLVSQYDDFDAFPLYVVVGGCVFSPLTLPLVTESLVQGKKTKSSSSFSRYFTDQRSGHEQLLVLSKVLNDDVNVGYHGWKNLILKSVNGSEPKNIQELVDILVRGIHSDVIEFRCTMVGQDDADYVICMDLNDVLDSEHRVMKQHMIASWCSTETISEALWEEGKRCEPLEAKRIVSWNTLKDTRALLIGKEEV